MITDTARQEVAETRTVDPVEQRPSFDRTESKIAVAGHPIHAMLVAFPIALTTCTTSRSALLVDGRYLLGAGGVVGLGRGLSVRCARRHRGHRRAADGPRHPRPLGELDALHHRGDAAVDLKPIGDTA